MLLTRCWTFLFFGFAWTALEIKEGLDAAVDGFQVVGV